MDDAVMRARVADARVGHLATVTRDGAPHVVPCCFVVEGDVVYTAVDDAKAKSTLALRRLDNVRAHPSAALLVDRYDEDWSTLWWIRVDGSAQVIESGSERDHAIDLLAVKYQQYARARPPGAVIALAIARWRAWP